MKNLLLALVLLLLVGGCATTNTEREYDRIISSEQSLKTFKAYATCMVAAAEEYSPSDATAIEIAEAAQSKCGREFYEYGRKHEAYLLTTAGSRWDSMQFAREISAKRVRETRTTLKDAVIQKV